MRCVLLSLLALAAGIELSHAAQRVVDIPTRPGITQRFLFDAPAEPKAAVILFAGGHGGLQLDDAGTMRFGKGNFLVRSAPLFAAQQLAVAVIDAPSDRQSPPHLLGFRHTADHAADVAAVIAWLRENTKGPVWLVGTSRGTQSAAAVATRLRGSDGPNGIVLTSTVVVDRRDVPVTDMAVDTLQIPVLIVHGSADDVVPVEHAHRIAGAAHNAELMVLEGAPHQLRLHPGVVELALEWLDRRVL